MSMCLVHGLVVLVGGAHFMFITYRIYKLYTESFAGVSRGAAGTGVGSRSTQNTHHVFYYTFLRYKYNIQDRRLQRYLLETYALRL